MILYCKNTPVYNIETGEACHPDLLPGLMQQDAYAGTFRQWMKSRYSSNTNSIARRLKGLTFGQGNRVRINQTTHALSLSDCYWIKEESDPTVFEEISPYYAPFWTGAGIYSSGAVPTLYVGGFLTKEWVSANLLQKYGDTSETEYLAIRLCEECGIAVNKAHRIPGGIAVENLTDPDVMIETAEQSGRLDVDDYTVEDVERLFGLAGIQMIVIDAVTGNGDRHPGNFGWYRDANKGEYLGMCPLYDFDHALDSTRERDFLTDEAVTLLAEIHNGEYTREALRICEATIHTDLHPVFTIRAESIREDILRRK